MAATVTQTFRTGPMLNGVITDVNPSKVRFSDSLGDGWAIGGADVEKVSGSGELESGTYSNFDFYNFVRPKAGNNGDVSAFEPQGDLSEDGALCTQTPQGSFVIGGEGVTLAYLPGYESAPCTVKAVPKAAPGTRFHAWCIGGGGARWRNAGTGAVTLQYARYHPDGQHLYLDNEIGLSTCFESMMPPPFTDVADSCFIGNVLVLNRERMAKHGLTSDEKSKAVFWYNSQWMDGGTKRTLPWQIKIGDGTNGWCLLSNAEYSTEDDALTFRIEGSSVFGDGEENEGMPASIRWSLFSLCKAFDWTLTLDMNGGGAAQTFARSGTDGVSLAAPSRAGCEFLGWTRTKDGDDFVEANLDGGRYAPADGEETLYAKWRGNTYTVTFRPNADDATLSASTAEVAFGEPYGDALPSASRAGWTLAGWTAEPDGGDVLTAESVVSAAADHTLYAKWRGVSLSVTKKPVGASADVSGVGRLSLRASTDGFASEVASEGDGGTLTYEGPSLVTYRLVCELGEASPDREWTAKGVDLGGGRYSGAECDISRSPGDWPVDFWLERKRVCTVLFAESAHGSAAVASATLPASDGSGYLAGGDVTVKVTPSAGYALSAVNFIDDATGFSIGGYDRMETDTFTLKGLNADVTVHMSFRLVEYSVSASVDPASSDAVASVSVKDAQGAVTAKATAESPATFTATVSGETDSAGNAKYAFAGWWTQDGVKVSSANPYTPATPSALALTAKASARVSLSLSHDDNRSDKTAEVEETCSLSVDGEAVSAPFSCMRTLGEPMQCAVTLGALGDGSGGSWLFGGWKRDGERDLGMGRSASVTIDGAMSLAAEVTSAPRQCVLTVLFKNADTGDTVDVSGVDGAVSAQPPPASVTASADGKVALSYPSAATVTVRLAAEIPSGSGSSTLALSGAGVRTVALTDDAQIDAEYSSEGDKTVSVALAYGCDESMGTVSLGGTSSEDADLPLSAVVERGGTVALLAVPANGYEFAGWFASPDGFGDPDVKDAAHTLTVTRDRSLYAAFRKASDAVFEWEGGSSNMMMEWRSRTYVFATPTNPVACRVDAMGYTPRSTATLSVEMFSSPDAAPTERATLSNIAGQGGRRLPVRRRERFMQIGVVADVEVDAVSVSTSMGGLAT